MRKTLNTLGNVLLTILVMILVFYGIAFVEMKIMLKKNFEIFNYSFVIVQDKSMIKDFQKGDIAIIDRDMDYDIGEKVLYIDNKGKYVISNVIYKDSVSITTKCNTCSKDSEPIENSKVIGKAFAKIGYLGWIIIFFKKKLVLILLAIFGMSCLIASRFVKYEPKVERVIPERKALTPRNVEEQNDTFNQ